MKEQTNIYGTTGILFSKSGRKKPTKGLLSIAVIAQKSSGDCSELSYSDTSLLILLFD